ncbi:MAG TPA: N-acetylmuramoyl-L-alanine amidase [Limnochordia bacterium]|nr:N-acetylmuramoyl-L-alanine amidase [Limnochordia bacterium]
MVMKRILLTGILAMNILGLTGCMPRSDLLNLTVQIQGQGNVEPQSTKGIAQGTVIDLKAVPGAGWRFSSWEGLVADPISPETTLLMDRQQTVKAIFLPDDKPQIFPAPGGLITRRADGSQVTGRTQGEADIEYIMIHAISDAAINPSNPYDLARIQTIFEEYGVESHYLIDRDGTIHQFVQDDRVARHAGVGTWNGDPKLANAMNRYSIGIELMGIGTRAEMKDVIGPFANTLVKAIDRGYTDAQYLALGSLLQHLTQLYKIPHENIISHRAYDPGRKWDPGELFDWTRIHY